MNAGRSKLSSSGPLDKQNGLVEILLLAIGVVILVVGALLLLTHTGSKANQTANTTTNIANRTPNPLVILPTAQTPREYARYFSFQKPTSWQVLGAPYTMYQGTIEEMAFQLSPQNVVVIQAVKTDYNSILTTYAGYHPTSQTQQIVGGHPATQFTFAPTTSFGYRTRIVVQGSGGVGCYLIDFIGSQQIITTAIVNQVVSTFRTTTT